MSELLTHFDGNMFSLFLLIYRTKTLFKTDLFYLCELWIRWYESFFCNFILRTIYMLLKSKHQIRTKMSYIITGTFMLASTVFFIILNLHHVWITDIKACLLFHHKPQFYEITLPVQMCIMFVSFANFYGNQCFQKYFQSNLRWKLLGLF